MASTYWSLGKPSRLKLPGVSILLFAAAATATISIRDPRPAWIYEFLSFIGAAIAIWRPSPIRLSLAIPLIAIALWGFVQLAFSATVYRDATVDTSLRMAAFAATFVAAATVFSQPKPRDLLIATLAWFGFAIAVTGVLAYFTSPSRILWIFPSPYPDNWGPFVSRNNFAQFLELTLPAALWRARHGSIASSAIAATILAAGIASASRAGSILLLGETIVCLILMRRVISIHLPARLLTAGVALVAIFNPTQLWQRLHAPDPFEFRREFAHSALAMIASHPFRGSGLGTFASVYPAYAEFDPGALVDHAHNDWLEWTSEGGIGFTAAWLALAFALLPCAVRSVWGIGILAIFLHALVDYPFARFGIAAWFFVIAGAASADLSEKFPRLTPLNQ